jgi:endonuclease/exonuclease/phosphatase (EEP) superfamily protein YafD
MVHDFFKPNLRLKGLLTAVGALTAAATLAGFLGKYAWAFDLASHFRVQYFLVLLLLSAGFFFTRRRWLGTGAMALAAVNFAVILPLYLGGHDAEGPTYRVMLINVNSRNRDAEAVLEAIERNQPDFLVIEEVNERWMKDLKPLHEAYPYSIVEERIDNFGIALLSRHAFTDSGIDCIGEAFLPSVHAVFTVDGNPLTLIGTHPLPPANPGYAAFRNEQLARLPAYLARFPGPLLLLGDLNVSPWSYYYGKFLDDTGLEDSSEGRGVQPTWPPLPLPFSIPIDHCFHNSGIGIANKRIGRPIGSDHLPVIVDFTMQAEVPDSEIHDIIEK